MALLGEYRAWSLLQVTRDRSMDLMVNRIVTKTLGQLTLLSINLPACPQQPQTCKAPSTILPPLAIKQISPETQLTHPTSGKAWHRRPRRPPNNWRSIFQGKTCDLIGNSVLIDQRIILAFYLSHWDCDRRILPAPLNWD